VELIRSRPGLNLNLRIASPVFRIHGSKDHANFADEVGIHDGRALNTRRPPSRGAGIDAVALDLDIGSADTGQLAVVGIVDQVIGEVESR
jgi:hypothetical protein